MEWEKNLFLSNNNLFLRNHIHFPGSLKTIQVVDLRSRKGFIPAVFSVLDEALAVRQLEQMTFYSFSSPSVKGLIITDLYCSCISMTPFQIKITQGLRLIIYYK